MVNSILTIDYDRMAAEEITQCGVAKGLVYNYFANKEELLLYTFISAFGQVEERFVSLMPPAGPVNALELFINGMFDFVKENSDYWRLQVGIMMQPSVPQCLQKTIMEKNPGIYCHVYRDI
jgi:AcrR family transcriptional regulator